VDQCPRTLDPGCPQSHGSGRPYLEEIQVGNMPFGGVWQTFLDHFTRRFAPLNTKDSARDVLKSTRQNKRTVAEYMAMFDQYAGQTGWSPVTFFLPITVHITDYHWDRHSYFVIHSYHAQTMTHTPPSMTHY
jgi:hypothetical protein